MADISGLLGRMAPNLDPDTKKAGAGLFDEFGIYTPSDKLQQRLQQQQAQQAQFAMQQQMNAQAQSMQLASAGAKANAPTGFNFSQFLSSGGMGNIQQADRLANQTTQAVRGMPTPSMVPQGIASDRADAAGIDPASIVTAALQRYPDRAQALKAAGAQIAALGQARNDPYLQNIGANLLTKSQSFEKDQAEIDQKKASTSKDIQDTTLAKAKAGRPGEWQNVRDAEGNINLTRQKMDANGGYIGDETKIGGPNKQVNASEDPMTNTQRGAEFTKFKDMVTDSASSIDSMDQIAKMLSDGAAQGWTAKAVTLMDNAVGSLNQLAPNASITASAQQSLDSYNKTFASWAAKTGIKESVLQDLVASLAKAQNGGKVTENDITRAMKQVGANLSNPATMAKVLEAQKDRVRANVDRAYKFSAADTQKDTKSIYNRFLKTYTPGATGQDNPDDTSDEPKGNNTEPNWDDAPAGTPAPKDEKEYDALPVGTEYWNPYLRKVVPKKK